MFKCIFLNENAQILIKISLKFVPKCPIYNIAAFVQIMAWRWPGDKPLSEPMMVSLLTHICITWPQWVNLPWLPILSIHIAHQISFMLCENCVVQGYNYEALNLTKPGTYVKTYSNYYICIKFESSSIKNGLRNVKKVLITNQVQKWMLYRTYLLCWAISIPKNEINDCEQYCRRYIAETNLS